MKGLTFSHLFMTLFLLFGFFLLSACNQADTLNGPGEEINGQTSGKISDLPIQNGYRYVVLYHTNENLQEIEENSICSIWNDQGDRIVREPCVTIQIAENAPNRPYLALAVTFEQDKGFTDYEATWHFIW